jgi:hypothetical protein
VVLAALGLVARHALAPRFRPQLFAQGIQPLWSPDGESIAYFPPANSGPRLRIDSLQGARFLELPLGDGAPSSYRCEWSPDGREIAVFDSQPGGWESQETCLRVYSSSDGRLVLTVPRSGPYARLAEDEYRKLSVPEWLQPLARKDPQEAPPPHEASDPSPRDAADRPEFDEPPVAEMLLGPHREGWYFTHPSFARQQRSGSREVHVIGEHVYLRDGRHDRRIAEGRDPRLSPDGSMAAFEREGSIYLVNLGPGG